MPDRMQQFIKIDSTMPDKRAAKDRRQDFDEIYDEYSAEGATEQASRCEQCGIPYCQIHCPLQNNIPDWLRLATEGRLQEAYETSQATNTFPEICGRICPQDRLCEGSCVLEQSRHGTVTIGAVEKYITDTAWKQGWVKAPVPREKLGLSVGIIGGGPAGLAAADHLLAMGYTVHVYDRYDRMGGLLIYGIPNFKLEKDIVERRTRLLADGGVVYHNNFEVGRDASLADLRAEHDAVLIATGVYKGRELQAPGSGLKNIFPAMEFLTASNRKGLGDKVPAFDDGTLNANGKNVVVIGGGDTAMDCVRTAVRQGAKSVKCLYRRDRVNMPGSQREVANAEEEGVEFVWLSAPEAFHGKDSLTAVQAHRMHLGVADITGRQIPEPIPGSNFNLEADIAIKALGFDPEDLPTLFGAPELAVTKWGTVKVSEPNKMTELEGVFAAGDIYRGASLVVWAIKDGRDAADGIHKYLQSCAKRADAA
ncbi:MAG: NAD(P)-dependent oxidoreductase [Rhodospirillales bacterium]